MMSHSSERGGGPDDTQVQMMQKIRRSSWHHSGFRAIWLGARRVSHPSSPPCPVSVSVTHAIRENILAFLATDQYDLDGQAPTALLLGTQLASVFSFPSVPHSPCWGRLWVIIMSVYVSNCGFSKAHEEESQWHFTQVQSCTISVFRSGGCNAGGLAECR